MNTCFDFQEMKKKMTNNRLSHSEVAKRAGVCRHTVRRMVDDPDAANPRLKTCMNVQHAIDGIVQELETQRGTDIANV